MLTLSRILRVFCYATIPLLISVSSVIAQPASMDWVRSSSSWWGSTVENMPKALGFGPKDYSAGQHPVRKEVTVILPNEQAVKEWEPAVLPPFSLEFSPARGLTEITGFYKGKKEDVVRALTKRYGSHSHELGALGLKTYVWVLDDTVLEISDVGYKAFPKRFAKLF